MGSDELPFYDTTAYLLEKKRSAEVRAAEATTDEERQAFLRIAEVWGRIAGKARGRRAEEVKPIDRLCIEGAIQPAVRLGLFIPAVSPNLLLISTGR